MLIDTSQNEKIKRRLGGMPNLLFMSHSTGGWEKVSRSNKGVMFVCD